MKVFFGMLKQHQILMMATLLIMSVMVFAVSNVEIVQGLWKTNVQHALMELELVWPKTIENMILPQKNVNV
jgi:cell shape-determining protein MreD